MMVPFVIGNIVGAFAGASFTLSLPDAALRICIALFVIWSAWGTIPLPPRGSGVVVGAVSAIASFLAMVIGATGPLVVALFRAAGLDHTRLVATAASGMVLQHLLKIVVFGLFGFAFGPWLPLIVAMLITGFLGTLAHCHQHERRGFPADLPDHPDAARAAVADQRRDGDDVEGGGLRAGSASFPSTDRECRENRRRCR
jgi:hypothetical protein